MTRSTWRVPFRGGSASSMRSVNMTSPTLSLLVIAEKAKSAPSSAASALFNWRHAAEARRGAGVDQQHHRQLALLGVALHVRLAGPRRHVPVDGAHLVAGLIEPHLGELHPAPLEDALVLAGEEVRHEVADVRIWIFRTALSCSRVSMRRRRR